MSYLCSKLMNGILHWDREVTLALNALHCPATDAAWQVLSCRALWYALCGAMVAYLFIRLGWKRALVAVAACALAFVLADRTAFFVKQAVARLRPCWDPEMLDGGLRLLEGKGGRYGFFSAHAANALALALCSFRCLRHDRARHAQGYAWVAFSLAFLIGISRVFVGKHYAGDVLAGWAVGALSGWLASWIFILSGRGRGMPRARRQGR